MSNQRAPEVELPDTELPPYSRQIPFLIRECESKLYKLEHVHIAPSHRDKDNSLAGDM